MGTPGTGEDALFSCPGEMAARCAAFDWAATSLGPVDGWSPSLRTMASVLLRTQFPMCLSWGSDLVLLYNDAFVATLGAKHPAALGAEISVVFAEIWDEVGYLQWSVLGGDEAVYAEDLPLVLERGSGPEETFYTFSYSHVPDDGPPGTTGPGGVLSVVTDTTRAVVGVRQMALLNALASATTDLDDEAMAVEAGLAVLAVADHDLQDGAFYLPGPDGELVLAGAFGAGPAWPPTVGPDHTSGLLHLDAGSTPAARVVLPLRTGSGSVGALVLTPHPLRPLDDEHHRFLRLVADHVGQLLTLASARADEHHRLASLAAADKAKSTFLSNVSHEFRTPLTLLLGPLEDALATGGSLDRADLTVMHQSAHRLLRMVTSLLEVSRVDAGARTADVEPTDVVRLTEDLLRPFAAAAERAGLGLRTRIEPGTGVVEVDPALWETILLNLTANALKYTLEGHVVIDLGRRDGELELRVEDTGLGIPDDEQARVFDRFHRVAGVAGRTIEGTGLGLALVADAVEAHGGTVTVDSTPGVGSVFVVRVPLLVATTPMTPMTTAPRVTETDDRVASALAEHVAPAVDDGTYPVGVPTGPVIVVVDDNPGMRRRLAATLAGLGQVVGCADGLEALELLRRQPVDLVVADVMMPRLDGQGLLCEIRSDEALAETPVILLSARAGTEAATEALRSGADDYVVKPFTRDELVARCRTTIELAALRASRSAEAARATMLAGISHDMQTPISVVSAVLEELGHADLDDDQRRRLVQRGASRAAQLEQLVEQLLDWTDLTAGTAIEPHAEPVDLSELLRRAADEHEGTRLDASVTSRPHMVLCDPARTGRILHDLIHNAHAASRHDISIRVADAGHDVEVHVVDDGPGVTDLDRARLFSSFGPTSQDPSSPLGLYVARGVARAQGGDLTLAASDDSGSRFVLRLPTGV